MRAHHLHAREDRAPALSPEDFAAKWNRRDGRPHKRHGRPYARARPHAATGPCVRPRHGHAREGCARSLDTPGEGASAPERTKASCRPHRASNQRKKKRYLATAPVIEWSKLRVENLKVAGSSPGESLLPRKPYDAAGGFAAARTFARRTARHSAGERPGGLRRDGKRAWRESGGPDCGWRCGFLEGVRSAGERAWWRTPRRSPGGRSALDRSAGRGGAEWGRPQTARPDANGRPEYARRSTPCGR